ncbi:MAG: methyltransferase [Verrucomicrobia bacterium]|nr:methyltransferase [Verrucomicrobiota bacterium]
MTSRERVLAALRHEPVDRVPIDLGGTRQSGIAAMAYHRLRLHLGLPARPVRVFDVFQMLAEIEREVAERFRADCVGLYRPQVAFGIENKDWKPWTLFDGTPVEVPGGFHPETLPNGDLALRRGQEIIGLMPKDGFYFDRLERYPGATHPDLDTWEPPRLDPATLDHLARQAEALFTTTDKAVIAPLGPPYELFNGLGQGGFDDWMVTLAAEPEYVRRLYEKLVDAWLDNLRAFHQRVGERIQVLQIADDLGTQRAPFLSVRMFRELVMPAYRRGLDWVHANTSWKVMLHSDGALYPLLPSIIEMGVDILNPVQTAAEGMGARRLKDEFGGRLVFWGGSCDPQTTLAFGTPEDVAREAREHLEVFGRDSGYVFAPVHNIQANVSPEKVVALFDTALGVGATA